jgi:hypothetical protein
MQAIRAAWDHAAQSVAIEEEDDERVDAVYAAQAARAQASRRPALATA